jgi:hypothetical protein
MSTAPTASIILARPSAPSERVTAPLHATLQTIKMVFEAFRDGVAAHDRYETLRARGVPHAVAATKAFEPL